MRSVMVVALPCSSVGTVGIIDEPGNTNWQLFRYRFDAQMAYEVADSSEGVFGPTGME